MHEYKIFIYLSEIKNSYCTKGINVVSSPPPLSLLELGVGIYGNILYSSLCNPSNLCVQGQQFRYFFCKFCNTVP